LTSNKKKAGADDSEGGGGWPGWPGDFKDPGGPHPLQGGGGQGIKKDGSFDPAYLIKEWSGGYWVTEKLQGAWGKEMDNKKSRI